ncbi:hypothetical protein CALCODRAFT_485201 [Calocera cornea HHB12733]|uniref:Methyltransferase type 11 domain-containing protein n=1 Tax=Calocera cornea HHB12733 TaxID=1353952 RepID=A0A165EHJ2_9BASI|nr:hypothetical protein CALCODRAFT_485201 [Calocera cornea HHB12733]
MALSGALLFWPKALKKHVRPIYLQYPEALYDKVFHYHAAGHGHFGRCIDLRCGRANATMRLGRRFKEVVGIDPEWKRFHLYWDNKMAQESRSGRVRFLNLGDLSAFEDETADMITAAQAAHAFSYPDVWSEIGRVLRPGGTAAFWSYPTLLLPDSNQYKSLNHKLLDFILGPTPERLGMYWDPNARRLLWSHYTELPRPPEEIFDISTFQLHHYHGNHFPSPWAPTPIHSEPVLQTMHGVDLAEWEQWLRMSEAGRKMRRANATQQHLRRRDAIGTFMEGLGLEVAAIKSQREVSLQMPLNLLLVRKRTGGRKQDQPTYAPSEGAVEEVQSTVGKATEERGEAATTTS